MTDYYIGEVPPATTAADLRNAALVMNHLGRGVSGFVDGPTGSVCLDGAIRLATEAKLVRHDEDVSQCQPYPFFALSDYESSSPRRIAATAALAEILPGRCTFKHPLGSCAFTDIRDGLLHEDARVYHFSDYICQGTEDSADLLVQAAEKLEADL